MAGSESMMTEPIHQPARPDGQPCACQPGPLGKTGLDLPRIIFGTSCLGNLYEILPRETKQAILGEIFRHSPLPVVLDSAGKYGAGLALEVIGQGLRELRVPPSQVVISNKLGWYRVPLRGSEPTFERGVWAGMDHDAESRISYEGILQCYEQGNELLGEGYTAQLVSVHDPDEFLAAAKTPAERQRRFAEVLRAYRALFDLKKSGFVKAVGIGCKDWRVIRDLAAHIPLEWVMFACSLTVYSHPPELRAFICHLHSRGVGMINSAVFHAGFLTGGTWFDYRQPDPEKDVALFQWREKFFAVCKKYSVKAADACVQFGLALPGVCAVALNTGKPERIRENIASADSPIPPAFWRALKDAGLVARDFPHLG
jgi:D-threo-aldose 1-dehydrogenase